MANPSKKKGTAAETKVVKYLQSKGLNAKRKALAGKDDEGDIDLLNNFGCRVTLEVKTGKMTANYSRSQLSEWLRQAEVEGNNAHTYSALVIVRYNRRIEDAEVWLINDGLSRKMMYLNEFAFAMSVKEYSLFT